MNAKLGSTQKAILVAIASDTNEWTDLLTALELAGRSEVTRRSQIPANDLVQMGLAEKAAEGGSAAMFRLTEAGKELVARIAGKARAEKKPVDNKEFVQRERLRFFAALPEKLTCTKCGKNRAKEDVGIRVVYPKKVGAQPLIYRQAQCRFCRNGKVA